MKNIYYITDFTEVSNWDRSRVINCLKFLNIKSTSNKKRYKREIYTYDDYKNFCNFFNDKKIKLTDDLKTKREICLQENINYEFFSTCVKRLNIEPSFDWEFGKDRFYYSQESCDKIHDYVVSKKENNLKGYSVKDLCILFNKDKSTINKALLNLNINILKGDFNKSIITNEEFVKIQDYFSVTEMTGISYMEKEIVTYIKSIYKDEILENDKNLINKELDIYIPSKNLAIELDGIYWHSNSIFITKNPNANKQEINFYTNKIKNKQLEKTILCEQKNIRLIHFWDSEWTDKKDICKSIIASSLGIYKEKYFARNLKIKVMTFDELNSMFRQNHLIGETKTIKFGLGLFNDKNECIQCMSFTNSKRDFKNKNDSIELNRMVTKLHTQVVGGFSKLLQNAIKIFNLSEIVSYIDRRTFSGKGYISCNFEIVKYNKPTYFYFVNHELKKRQYGLLSNFKKRAENNNGIYKEGLTELQLSWINNIPRVYDCGTIKVKYEF